MLDIRNREDQADRQFKKACESGSDLINIIKRESISSSSDPPRS